jgi:hypothetical protein
MIQISVIVHPNENKLTWSVQFQNPRILEDRYVATHLSTQVSRFENPTFSKQKQEYLRNRFRNYMNHFQLYKSQNEKLELSFSIDRNQVCVKDTSHDTLLPCYH